jgi:hypothetical protein
MIKDAAANLPPIAPATVLRGSPAQNIRQNSEGFRIIQNDPGLLKQTYFIVHQPG